MSIGMFIINATGDSEKPFYIPVSSERVFNEIILPVAEQIGAEMVCKFGIGLEIGSSDISRLEGELRNVMVNLPPSVAAKEYIEPRIRNLVAEIRRIFEESPDVSLYIG